MMDDKTLLIDADIYNISPSDFRLYLERLGWIVSDSKFKSFMVAKSPVDEQGNYVDIPFPSDTNVTEYIQNMKHSILQIAQVLNSEPSTIARQIKQISSDLVFIRILEPLALSNSIALPLAEKIINSFYNLLQYGAQSVEEIKPRFGRLNDSSYAFANNCRFAHTFKGSFGLTIESPLSLPSLGMQGIEIEVPFERKAVERIFKGLTIAEVATENNSADFIVENYVDGFNANMCESMVAVAEGLPFIGIEYQAGWSPLVPFDQSRGIKNKIQLKEKSFRLLSEASRQLKKEEDEKEIIIVGFVTSLKAPVGFFKNEESQRLVEVEGTTTDGTPLKITTQLKIEDYLKAIEAHKNNLDIRITGTLKKVGRRRVLTSYSDFVVRV